MNRRMLLIWSSLIAPTVLSSERMVLKMFTCLEPSLHLMTGIVFTGPVVLDVSSLLWTMNLCLGAHMALIASCRLLAIAAMVHTGLWCMLLEQMMKAECGLSVRMANGVLGVLLLVSVGDGSMSSHFMLYL